MAMLETVRNSLKMPGLRNRLLFTLAMLLVFRVGAHIPVPGIRPEMVEQLFEGMGFFGLVDIFSGGAFRTFSIFAMSIVPYINASIIMNLLTVVIPRLEQLSKEGEEGRKKIQQYVRYLTVVLALVQATGLSLALRNYQALENPGAGSIALIVLTLTAGTAFLMWLGEMITDKGIGNGISLLIFAGIVSQVPGALVGIVELLRAGQVNFINVLVLVVIGALVIAFVVMILEGQRRIPIQYAKRVVGRRVYGGQTTYLPLKVNQAGVIPVIFAQSLILLPITVAGFAPNATWALWVQRVFNFDKPAYMITYATLIILFTFFYTAITFNPVDVANNVRKNGGFIPGLRPGKPTSDYLTRVLYRITFAGAIFLAGISILPQFIIAITGIPNAYLGGTALLIVVGVALETMKQIEAHMVMRHYQSFMK